MLRSTTTTPTRCSSSSSPRAARWRKSGVAVWQNYTPRWLNSFDTISSSSAPTCFPSVCFPWPRVYCRSSGSHGFGLWLRGRTLATFLALCMAFCPIAVSTSVTVRPYAPFMAFLTWGLAYFARYQGQQRPGDLLSFAVLIFLAAASHFSGFLVAAVCGINEGLRAVLARQWTRLASLVAAFLPLLALGSLLYLHYATQGAAGPMWNRLVTHTGFAPPDIAGRLAATFAGFLGELLPFVTLFGSVRSAGLQRMLLIMSFAVCIMHAGGLFRMYGVARKPFWLVSTAWVVALGASVANIYPFSPNRHGYCWFPLLLLPIGYLLEGLIRSRRSVAVIAAVVILLVPPILVRSGIYLRYGQEFTLRQRDYELGQAHLAKHMEPGDAIVTSRVTYSYFVHAKGGGEYPYDGYGSLPYFGDTTLLAPFDPPFERDHTWVPFRDDLAAQLGGNALPLTGRIWFVMYGWKSAEILESDDVPARAARHRPLSES